MSKNQYSFCEYTVKLSGENRHCHFLTPSCFAGITTVTRVNSCLRTKLIISQPPKPSWQESPYHRSKNVLGQTETECDTTGIQTAWASMMGKERCARFSNLTLDTLLPDISDGSVRRGPMNYKCKMCGYDQMPFPPIRHNICPCCGIEYGVDDTIETLEFLRDDWLRNGAPWFSTLDPYLPPLNWNPWDQLDRAGYQYSVPRPESGITVQNTPPPVWSGQFVSQAERLTWN